SDRVVAVHPDAAIAADASRATRRVVLNPLLNIYKLASLSVDVLIFEFRLQSLRRGLPRVEAPDDSRNASSRPWRRQGTFRIMRGSRVTLDTSETLDLCGRPG